ncbi:MAG: M16 family metallopeptidase [Paracoccaceae bacterium]
MRAPLIAALLSVPGLAVPALASPDVSQFTLENGLRGIVIEDHRAPVVTHMVWYPVGAADEPHGQSGIAHFLEHLMFKGTDEIPEGAFSKIVAENGGQDNAFTSYDYTAYFQRIAADRLDIVMEMEADRMRDLVLNDRIVATERDVILEERAQRTDNSPQALFSEQLSAALYLNHPYGVPVIGWRHEMETLDLDDAFAFYERYYAPDNAILVVAGDVEPSEVKRLAEIHYGPLEPSGRPPEARPLDPPQLAERRLAMSDPRVRQPYVVRSYKTPSRGTGDPAEAAALEVLSRILGSGVSSRLSKRLELEGKTAISAGAWYAAERRDYGTFTVFGVPVEGIELDRVEADIDAVLAEIVADGPTEAELARVKRVFKTDWIYAQDSQRTLANRYGSGLANGYTVAEIEGWPDLIAAVTAEDVRRVAAEHLVRERSVTGRLTRAVEEQG